MSEDWTAWVPPRGFELFRDPVPDVDGPAWLLGECKDFCFPTEMGATPPRAPLAWGEEGDAPSDAAWVKVDELDPLLTFGGERVGVWAVYQDGHLYLHIGSEPESTGGGDWSIERAGGGLVCEVGGAELPREVGRAVAPDICLVQLEKRDAFLKDTTGRWHADFAWDIVGCLSFQRQRPDPVGSINVGAMHYRNLTLWAVTNGNMLAFMSTVTDALEWASGNNGLTMDAKNWSAFGSLMRCYNYNPQDEYAGTNPGIPGWWNSQFNVGEQLDAIDVVASFPSGFTNVAWLPWQNEGERAVFTSGDWEEQNCGTMNMVGVNDDGGMPWRSSSQVTDGGLYFCPRLHVCGDRVGGCMAFSKAQVATILYGDAGDFGEWFPDLYTLYDDRGQAQHVVAPAAFQLLYNPWAVEAVGMSSRESRGFLRRGYDRFLPPATDCWRRVAAVTLQGPVDEVYWEIAGADVDGCLLTASCCTNYQN